MKIIKPKCKQEDVEDKTLPTHAYVVGYVDDEFCQDIVIAQKQADVFDYYWDLYKEKLQYIKQAAGTVSPNLWNDSTPKPPKKPKK